MKSGLVGQFVSSDALRDAVLEMRKEGFTRMDAHMPYPVKDVIEALDFPRSRVPLYAAGAGLFGACYAYLIQWWVNGFDYALNVGGRPLGSTPAFIPPTFEGVILLASLTAVGSFFAFSRIPRLWAPINEVRGFERASVDRFFLTLDATDPSWDVGKAESILINAGAEVVSAFGLLPEEVEA